MVTKRCKSCNSIVEAGEYLTSIGAVSDNCRECRRAYIRARQDEKGVQQCWNCKKEFPKKDFISNSGVQCNSCRGCRIDWSKQQQKG